MSMKQLTFLDLCSGIGGFRLGLESAGHKCVGYCEYVVRDGKRIKYSELIKEGDTHDAVDLP